MYLLEGNVVSLYQDRNGYRISPYHRADISLTYYPKENKNNHWVFSVYNVYNRLNPYFIFFSTEGSAADGDLQISAKQISLFPIIPSFTWNFKF